MNQKGKKKKKTRNPRYQKDFWGRSLNADKLQASLLGHACRSLLWYAGIINTASPFQGMRAVDLKHPL